MGPAPPNRPAPGWRKEAPEPHLDTAKDRIDEKLRSSTDSTRRGALYNGGISVA